ncbi:MAG: hypothetical protein HYV93_20430 [Candidatus Rokubacteria bacterium]|nr:hypothetical protein [Candidatus Rokubacteria bacterium]
MVQPESVLVVSPDATSLEGLTRALTGNGLLVARALGWPEAESRLRRLPVSVVVADLEELGPEELAQVRRLRSEFPNLGVIALVSISGPEVRAAETQGLVRAVLEKPIAIARLEESVKLALARTVSP